MSRKLNWRAVGKGNFDGSLAFMEAELEDGYLVEMGLERNADGVLQCISFKLVWPHLQDIPPQVITSRSFQLLGFGQLLASARNAYGEWREVVNEVYEEIEVDRLLEAWTSFGPTVIPDEYYAAVAWKYEKFVLLGLDNPIGALSEFMQSDRTTTSSRVVEARNRGLLTKPKEGNFGGQLTNKGRKALGMEVINAKKGK
ncbi:MAG: hypothetical protein D4R50_03545 [Actinomycetales bacterium]|nr:MAG: hypothetical protein D4R50_03545 [Actinomycetales bacterium]